MEALVGRAVRKAFPGYGVYSGAVQSYDAVAGYFRVLYEDGDSEEVDADELAGILVGGSAMPRTPPRDAAGRRPKKRRRVDDEEDSPTQAAGDGVVLAVAAPSGGSSDAEAEPTTPAGKKRRPSPARAPESSSRPVRRSARQAKAAAQAAEMEAVAAAAAEEEAEAESAVTPQQSGKKRSRVNRSGRYRSVSKDLEEAVVEQLSSKPELPPSSQSLDLEGLPVLDLFQVYSCLRSFTKELFLSPFPLETFVSMLRCTHVNPLIDWVHFAMLRALKGHLEDFAAEGDPSSVHCIRNLNWELLDLATWPIYLAEYMLTRGSELRYGMKLTDLKLLSTEYYGQPALVKLELLRSLSDDVLEIEAIRSKLSEADGNGEGVRSSGLIRKKKNSSRASIDSPPLEGSDDMDDGNSDECHLCGMDGNLLCCDGCPAAFHSKCVGVVEDLLPEGDWYCPECSIQSSDGFRNKANPMRGAEVLGIDPHGRLYFGTCGYILVVDSCDVDSSCHYYAQTDLHSLVAVLKPCHYSYNPIINAISSFCSNVTKAPSANGFNRYQSSVECSTSGADTDLIRLLPLKQSSSFEQLDSGKGCSSNPDQLDKDASHQNTTSKSALKAGSTSEMIAEEMSYHTPQNNASGAKNNRCNLRQDAIRSHANGLSAVDQKYSAEEKPSDCHLCSDPTRYINYYSFGQIAASAAEELKNKLSENLEAKKPAQDTPSFHLRTICRKYATIFALADQKLSVELLKEKCGWCNSCQVSGGVDCIFRLTKVKCLEGPKSHTFGLRAETNKESHIGLAIRIILSIEERLNGLLTGPWQKPQYSDCWRKAVLEASDVASLKQPLLTLESSLRRIAISAEWQKPADSVEVVGSAAHILVRSSNKSLSHGSAKKTGRKSASNSELKVDSCDVGVYWWRGGALSRQVFHWKRLPQSLACKAARQAGRRKIPTISYPDGSQFARRFKCIAWQAAVEMAENVSQLILQIKELEWNIKWTEILSTLPSSLATKETQKIAKLFKKVIIRRKRVDGTNVEYLLDFGKRENIPPVVAKHGTKFEEPSIERNRYWLNEGHVPLNLLKPYEAKALARLLKKKETDGLPKKTKKLQDSKPKKQKQSGLDYVFEKAKRLSIRLCGECNKEVIAREAVNCQYCAALFHKKHFKVPRGAAHTIYVCNKCLAEKDLKVESPLKKAAPKNSPKKKQSCKIVTRRNQIVLKYRKKTGKKGKRGRPRKNPENVVTNEFLKVPEGKSSNVLKNEPVKRISKRLYHKYMKDNSNISEHATSCRKRKRTQSHYSYWLNGLRWTQNPDDERARNFRKERIVFPSEEAEISELSPVCCRCEKCNSEKAIYVACEKCEDWFHGHIYSVTLENVNNLIGFMCHICRQRNVPVCPYAQTDSALKAQSDEEHISSKFDEDSCHSFREELGAHGSHKELHDCNIEKRINGHVTSKGLNDFLKELNGHSSLSEVVSRSGAGELDAHNKMELIDSSVFKNEFDDYTCLKELDNQNYLDKCDSYMTEKELNNHNCVNELDIHTNLKELDGHNGGKELDGTSSKFAAEETQCLNELDSFNDLNLDDYSFMKEFDNHNCPKESDNRNSSIELGNNRSPKFDSTDDIKVASATSSGDFLAKHFNDIGISSKEALIITSENGSGKESRALQSKDVPEKSIPPQCEADIQVLVRL